MKKYSSVDVYLRDEERWPKEAEALRAILLACKLDEDIKWGKPCYSHGDNNIAIMQSMKGFLALLFFKGALLDDPEGRLESQGENTRSAKRLCFTEVKQIKQSKSAIQRLVRQAIEVEKAGKTVPKAKLELAAELAQRLAKDRALKKAFEALTPGRQREYNIYIAGAKQSATRAARVDKHVERILAGKGLRER